MADSDIPPSSLPSAPTQRQRLRILYADDMRELRDVARISFSREGHDIECFADGSLALQRVMEEPTFDLIITDHHMPIMNGLEFVGRLREAQYRGKLMVFSSELASHVGEEYRRLGVDRILYKPVFPSVLRQAMAELFSLPLPVALDGGGGGGASVSPFPVPRWHC